MVAMCKEHWELLKAAVVERGMEALIHQSGDDAVSSIVAELEGRKEEVQFDPLLAANFAIINRMMDNIGNASGPSAALSFMCSNECPLCLVQKSFDAVSVTSEFDPDRHKNVDWWVDSCMNAMLDYAQKENLVPRVQ